jgi:hypothetical protein
MTLISQSPPEKLQPPTFRFNDGEFEIPSGWEDRSVIALSFPAGAKKPEASFAVTRDNSAGQESSLGLYVDKQLVDLAKACPRFELIRRDQVKTNDLVGQQLEFRWKSPDGTTVRQEQTILLLKTGTALTLTGTAPDPKFAEYAPLFRHMFDRFRLRT